MDEKDILTGWKYDGGESVDGISADFIKQQSHDWLLEFYQWLSETQSRTSLAKNKAIFIDGAGNAVASFSEAEQPILFLPDNDGDGYTTLSPELFAKAEEKLQSSYSGEKQTAKEFFGHFGIREHTVKDGIDSAIVKMRNGEIPADNFFAKAVPRNRIPN